MSLLHLHAPSYRVISRSTGVVLRQSTPASWHRRGRRSLSTFQLSASPTSRTTISAAKTPPSDELQEQGKYKSTVDLPKTSFTLRANSSVREPEIQSMWEECQVLDRVLANNKGPKFVLHDGPPYANGDLHMGHAFNKILKDIINRYKILKDHQVCFVPGWDCHGLPIELKVLQSLDEKTRKDLTPLKLRAKASKFAKSTVESQKAAFKRYGIWGDWRNPYLTLNPEYEAAQIEVFGEMALKGYIYRGRKPVHWSPSSRTALAEAELEYPDGHTSRSVYAMFRVRSDSLQQLFPDLHLAIWTTTPWTIPANAAVAVNGKIRYVVVEARKENSESEFPLHLIVAEGLVATLEAKWGMKLTVKQALTVTDLENCRYLHPLDGRECPVVLGGDYITTESGTGLVHTAPGHGQEDYKTGLKYGLPVHSPVDDDGKFTDEAGEFKGLDVLTDGNSAVINYLNRKNTLIIEEPYKHKYPYDWRTKKPTIFRATDQWFASVEGFRAAALDAIERVKWFPPQGQNRISAMTSSRSDWCISRQRTWGVPIPVFYHVDTKEPLMNEETISYVKSVIAEKGSDAWWYMKLEDLLPPKYRDLASKYEKGTDTMDVWFDSGSSWAAVLGKRGELCFPADLYLEGSDQHRGWFQSSLLTSIATTGQAPYSSVMTHGFVLDEKGLKMSKSLGNVIDPRIVIEGGKNSKESPGYGADVLRLWVSSVDYTSDVMIGPQVLKQMAETYRKLRGTLRYLLANLHDWKAESAVEYDDLPSIDKHSLFQLENVVRNVNDGYENYQFFKIFQILQRFAIVDLSSFYFDVAKDRLYVGGTTSFTRRSCQTVLAAHLLSLVRILAPIMPHLAEDVWQHLPFAYTTANGSNAKFVFEAKWPDPNEKWLGFPADEVAFWEILLEMRTEVNSALEAARTEKLIGSSLDAKVYVYTDDAILASRLRDTMCSSNEVDSLHRVFITSEVEVVDRTVNTPYWREYDSEGKRKVWIGVARAEGLKCERCWNYTSDVGSFIEHPTLCRRCFGAVSALTEPKMPAFI